MEVGPTVPAEVRKCVPAVPSCLWGSWIDAAVDIEGVVEGVLEEEDGKEEDWEEESEVPSYPNRITLPRFPHL